MCSEEGTITYTFSDAGFDMKNGMLTDELVIWLHDERMKKRLDIDFYELLVKCGLRNEHIV